MHNINGIISITIPTDDPLRWGFATMRIVGIAYEPIAYLCEVIECIGSKEFKKDEEITILPYTGEILVSGNREKKDGLFIGDMFGMQTGQWCLV